MTIAARRMMRRHKQSPLEVARTLGIISNEPLNATFPDVEWGGTDPVLANGILTCGANPYPVNDRYRSEVIWSTATEVAPYFKFASGERMVSEFDVRFSGLTNGGYAAWNVLWQLLGHTLNSPNQWPGPPVILAYDNGMFHVVGGSVVPTGNTVAGQTPGTQEAMEVTRDLYSQAPMNVPGADNIWFHWMLSVQFGDPGSGNIYAWCNDVQCVSGWSPTAGTFYTVPNGYANAYLYVKTAYIVALVTTMYYHKRAWSKLKMYA